MSYVAQKFYDIFSLCSENTRNIILTKSGIHAVQVYRCLINIRTKHYLADAGFF